MQHANSAAAQGHTVSKFLAETVDPSRIRPNILISQSKQ